MTRHQRTQSGRKDTGERPPRTPPKRPLLWFAVALGALALAVGSYRIYVRYGATDIGQAETIVYGMLLFIAAIAVFAFLVVAMFKLIKRILGPKRSFLDIDKD